MATDELTPEPPGPELPVTATVAYVAEPSTDLVAMSFPGARAIAGWLFWVIFPLLCLVSIVFVIIAIASHVGHRPDGIRGEFVGSRTCSRGVCLVGGGFTSDDGSIKNLRVVGDSRWRTGERHEVIYDPKGYEVTALPGHWDPTTRAIAGVGALCYLGVVGYFARAGRQAGKR
jgi:hypothetical protein